LPSGILTFNPNDPLELIVLTDDLTLRGTYQITIGATAGNINDNSQTFQIDF